MARIGIALSALLSLLIASNVVAQITLDETLQQQMALTNLSSMPLAFTENRGQFGENTLFKANAGGATFYFCKDGVAYLFVRNTNELFEDEVLSSPNLPGIPDNLNRPHYKRESMLIKAQFVGANPNPEIIGVDRLSHNNNYFYGNDSDKWRTDVPNYLSITYKDIYPGIDLKYHGNEQRMKYDFIINPGADISQIQIRYEGADNLAITPNGDLEATTLFGPIHENIPSVYQEIGGDIRELTGRYIIRAPRVFGFEVDDYNPSLALVIDPELVYSTYLGGNDEDSAWDIAVDGTGNAYVAGWTWSSDFPTVNPYDGSFNGIYRDGFITKLSSIGNSLIYSTFLGGGGNENVLGIIVDGSGNTFVTGHTSSSNFPTVNPYDGSFNGGYDAFVTKLSPNGNSLIYSTYLGGSDWDGSSDMAVDGSGSAYVTGRTFSSDFPTVNPYDGSLYGSVDVYVSKFSPAGNSLTYSTYLGGSVYDYGHSIAVDGSGSAYVTGYTNSSNFPTVNPYDGSFNGSDDVFITKFSPNGNSLIYSTFLGGGGVDFGKGIAVDGLGRAYVTGWTYSSDFPTVFPYDESNNGSTDVFVTKLSAAGNSLAYSTYLGGSSGDGGEAIAVDGVWNAYVTGHTSSSDFPTVNPYDGNFNGGSDVFVTRLSSIGISLTYSTYMGGSGNESGEGIAVDGLGNAYVTGYTWSSDFPTVNPYDGTFNGGEYDAFVAKFGPVQQEIPTLSEWGMLIMALILLAIGTVAVVRRRKAVVGKAA